MDCVLKLMMYSGWVLISLIILESLFNYPTIIAQTNDISPLIVSRRITECNGSPQCQLNMFTNYCQKYVKLELQREHTGNQKLPQHVDVSLSASDKIFAHGFLKGSSRVATENINSTRLTFCYPSVESLQWVNVNLSPDEPKKNKPSNIKSNAGKKKAQKTKPIVLEVSAAVLIIFKKLSSCVLVDDLYTKIFWVDTTQGTIQVYDILKNKITILASSLDKPGIIVIDTKLKFLFWTSLVVGGGIERINFDGFDRIQIVNGKYPLQFPDQLRIDTEKQILYWTSNGTIHSCDYNGNNHMILSHSKPFLPNYPSCINSLADEFQHNYFWENIHKKSDDKHLKEYYLLSIQYQKDGASADEMKKLPAMFQAAGTALLRTSHMCQQTDYVYHCVSEPQPINVSILTVSNSLLANSGYKPWSINKLFNFHPIHSRMLLNAQSLYVNTETNQVFYYDVVRKFIRLIFPHQQQTTVLVRNIDIPTNGLVYDGLGNSIFCIDAAENNIKVLKLNYSGNIMNTTTIINATDYQTIVALGIDAKKRTLFYATRESNTMKIYKYQTNVVGATGSFVKNMLPSSEDFIVVDPFNDHISSMNKMDDEIEIFDLKEKKSTKIYTPTIFVYNKNSMGNNGEHSLANIVPSEVLIGVAIIWNI